MNVILRWFWTLLPGNPLVVRTVQVGSRRMSHFWGRVGYLGALMLLVMFGLMTGGGMTGEHSMTALAKSGTQVFSVIAYTQVTLICLIAPLFMAGAISQEQAGETFDILLTTPLSNVQIVLGALAGRLFFVLALLAAGVPLFSVLLVFGGVPVDAIFVSFAVAGLVALAVGAVAVALAVLRIGGRKAVFTFVVAVAAYMVAGYGVDMAVRQLPSSQ
ncbi:MAG: hypothetical protein R3336_09140, partial [Phycisphaeraceae bacterium]|nr:hypothetical protein [Phycisphaeraceae bacterium]